MTIQGSSPVAATTMTTPNTPSLLRSLYFFLRGFAHGTTVCHLLIPAFIFAFVESATTATRLLVFFSLCFFFHTTDFSNTLLFSFYGLSISTTPNHSWKISAIRCEVLVVFIDCTSPSDLYGISVIFTDPTEKWSSSFLSFSLSLCLFVDLSMFMFIFVCSTHSLLYIAGSSSLHCPGGFGFGFRG